MTVKRIIPCLDMKDGRVVKGIQFVGLRDAGDPVELAKYYVEQGADELVFLDISASQEERQTMIDVVKKTAEEVNIPFTVGGGVRTLEDMKRILDAGADKVSMNTSALANPEIIKQGAEAFGSERIVIAIDASFSEEDGTWMVYTHGGNKKSEWKAVEWAKKVEELGAGEILLTSINKDGEKSGYDLELTKAICEAVSIPVIASGGAGNKEHFREVLQDVGASAALAASIFHYKETSVAEVKSYLREKGVNIQ